MATGWLDPETEDRFYSDGLSNKKWVKKAGSSQWILTVDETSDDEESEEMETCPIPESVQTSGPAWRVTKYGSYMNIENPYNGPLPAGTYSAALDPNGEWIYRVMKQNSDSLIHLPGLPIDYILKQVEQFWERADRYKKYGFLQKRGILLYGPPGCGKSSIVGLLREQLIKRNGVIFTPASDFSLLSAGLSAFRSVEPNRPIMTLVEDIESLLEGSNGSNNGTSEKAALAMYDGESQLNNIVHVATTNKPDSIADRFIRRPGRFDVIIGVHAPARETREAYLQAIGNGQITQQQISDIVDRTDGLSLAYLREIASTYLVLDIPLDESIERLRAQAKAKYSGGKTGFTIGFTEDK